MNNNLVFQYVILWEPKDDQKEDTKIVVPPTTVLSKDQPTVGIMAARAIPDQYLNQIDQLRILIRQF